MGWTLKGTGKKRGEEGGKKPRLVISNPRVMGEKKNKRKETAR